MERQPVFSEILLLVYPNLKHRYTLCSPYIPVNLRMPGLLFKPDWSKRHRQKSNPQDSTSDFLAFSLLQWYSFDNICGRCQYTFRKPGNRLSRKTAARPVISSSFPQTLQRIGKNALSGFVNQLCAIPCKMSVFGLFSLKESEGTEVLKEHRAYPGVLSLCVFR